MKKFLYFFLISNNILCTIYEQDLIITKSEITENNFKHIYYVKVYDKSGIKFFQTDHDSRIESIALSNNQKFLVMADKNGTLMLANLISKVIMHKPGYRLNITKIIFNKDDSWLIIACLNRIVIIDIKSFDILYEFDCLDNVKHIAINETNNYLVTASDFNRIKVWDIETGECYLDLKDKYSNAICKISIIIVNNKPIIKIYASNPMFFCLLTGEKLVIDDKKYLCLETNKSLEIKDYGDNIVKICTIEYMNALKQLKI